MSHCPVFRIEFELPELSPAQAALLWNFFDQLAYEIWRAYDPESFAFEDGDVPSSAGHDEAAPQPKALSLDTDTALTGDGDPHPEA